MSTGVLPTRHPCGVQEAASAEGGFPDTSGHHLVWCGGVPKDLPELATKPVYVSAHTHTHRHDRILTRQATG